MSTVDVLRITRKALLGLGPPIYLKDNTRSRPVPTDILAMINEGPPAYHVLVAVNGAGMGCLGPWVAVTHTSRFGFTPTNDGYTYLYPPPDLDQGDPVAVTAWLVPALLKAVVQHAPLAAAAKTGDVGLTGPVEARDAITRVG